MNPQAPNQQPYTGFQPPAPLPGSPAPGSPFHTPQPQFNPAPAMPGEGVGASDQLAPTPVIQVFSPTGVEYVFLTLTLFVGAISLTSALIALVNGAAGFATLAFPAAALIVTLPIFAAIFLHLKKKELQDPRLKFDASKRRTTQATQIISFIVCLFTLIGFLAAVFATIGGSGEYVTIGKAALDALCVLVVAGGILFYYWRDEHKTRV